MNTLTEGQIDKAIAAGRKRLPAAIAREQETTAALREVQGRLSGTEAKRRALLAPLLRQMGAVVLGDGRGPDAEREAEVCALDRAIEDLMREEERARSECSRARADLRGLRESLQSLEHVHLPAAQAHGPLKRGGPAVIGTGGLQGY